METSTLPLLLGERKEGVAVRDGAPGTPDHRRRATQSEVGRPQADGGSDVEDRLVLTVAEVAKILGISKSFAYELCATGGLPALRLGRRVVVPRRALVEFVETVGAAPARSSSILSLRVRPQSSAAAASTTGRTLA